MWVYGSLREPKEDSATHLATGEQFTWCPRGQAAIHLLQQEDTLRYHTLPKPSTQLCPQEGHTTGPTPQWCKRKLDLSRASP